MTFQAVKHICLHSLHNCNDHGYSKNIYGTLTFSTSHLLRDSRNFIVIWQTLAILRSGEHLKDDRRR